MDLYMSNISFILNLLHACKNCETTLFLVDQAMEDLPMRQLDRARVVDALYNANKCKSVKN